jgi:FGGY-family pentulose kinase
MGEFVLAVDVGTGSARAGLFDRRGRLVARAEHPILTNRETPDIAEHSSEDIWNSVVAAVRKAVETVGVDRASINAIGFDATCSLVVLTRDGEPVDMSIHGGGAWDTICWFDHRAAAEAERMTVTGHPALRHAGEILSPEMQLPKLLWLKEKRPDAWQKAGLIFDLADYLTYRATGSAVRSLSTLTTKWNYLAHAEEGWSKDFLTAVGLPELKEKAGMTGSPVAPGKPVGMLSNEAAEILGLRAGIPVAAGMVDAFAGLLSLLGSDPDRNDKAALIGGTSSCVMRLSAEPQFVRSFWGPYRDVALDGFWVIEGGQSATGALLDLILRTHGAGGCIDSECHEKVLDRIEALLKEKGPGFAGDLHVLPDYHGNRAPLGDVTSRGVVHGLSLDPSFDGLCAVYYRAMVALALGVRQIIELLEEKGSPIAQLAFGGGHVRNRLLTQLYADATGREIMIGAGDEAMLHGTAIAAATAASWHGNLAESSQSMRREEMLIRPRPQPALDRDFRVFLMMQEHRRQIAAIR